ncbi:MAG TPA: hypothetical protein VM890_14215 [Longimicrobium sp.]|nr:hypothetical protein [Longimicrobium sp.]
MAKIKLDLDALQVESFATDATEIPGGTVYAHESEGCKQIPPGMLRKTHQNSCFVASCNNGSCFDCSIQISCWGCNTPLCPAVPFIDSKDKCTFGHGCIEH